MALAEQGNEYFAAMERGHVVGSGLQGLWGQVPTGMQRIRWHKGVRWVLLQAEQLEALLTELFE